MIALHNQELSSSLVAKLDTAAVGAATAWLKEHIVFARSSLTGDDSESQAVHLFSNARLFFVDALHRLIVQFSLDTQSFDLCHEQDRQRRGLDLDETKLCSFSFPSLM